ncbi:MAG: insulinase family protein [Candidatus Aminicenantes bacterium]|nr:MAG: insulinase family protein [Candidatus Aminicenantes bacterium]
MKTHKALFIIVATSCFLLSILFPVYPGQDVSPAKVQAKKKVLENGLTLIYQNDASSAITVIQILIRGGMKADPEDKQGLAYLTTRLALEIPDDITAQNMMSQASQVYLMCLGDYSLINITSLSENLDETLKTVSQIILDPLFSAIRIDHIKKQMDYRKKMQEDDAINVGRNAALERFFAATGYGGSVLGSEKSLKTIKRKDIKSFYETHFKAGNMVVAAISDMEEAALSGILEKYFNPFPAGKPAEPEAFAISSSEDDDIFIEKDTQQYFVSMAFPLPEITPKNYALAYMIENLLGKGLNSRLWSLRTQEKLAYNVNSNLTQMKFGGMMEAYLETDKEKKEAAVEALRKVLADFYENGITEEEFEVTKTFSKASFLRANETKTTRTRNLSSFEALGLGFTFLERLPSEMEAISLEEINAYIKDIFDPIKGLEIIVGPKEE